MKVILLRSADGREQFLSAGPIAFNSPEPARGRVERLVRRLQASVLISGRHVGPRLKRIRDWLECRVRPDEGMLQAFRHAGSAVVEYPDDWAESEARDRWIAYLRDRQIFHLRRFSLSLLLCPISLLLAPLPGPNIVGYWFVWRAFRHGMILRGLRRAAGGSIPTTFEAHSSLASPLDPAAYDKLMRAAGRHEGVRLESLMAEALGRPDRPVVRPRPVDRPAAVGRAEPWYPWWSLLPNALTLIRLGLAAAFPMADRSCWVAMYLASAATEALDGMLSRALHATTLFGRILDPIADKLFVLSVLATLWRTGILDARLIPLLAARDLIVVLGALWLIPWEGFGAISRMRPSPLGKVATAGQFLFLLWTLIGQAVDPWSATAVSIVSIAAGLDYLRRFR
ncbi:MAG: CDP-alcohol phosphatidyltransferase family protein [Isosphaeraceae bacterium]